MQTTNWECWVALHCWYMLIPHVYIVGLVMETMTSFPVVPWLVDLWGASQLSQEDWLQTATRLRGQSLVFVWWKSDEGKFPQCNHQPSMKRWENMGNGLPDSKSFELILRFFFFCFGPWAKKCLFGNFHVFTLRSFHFLQLRLADEVKRAAELGFTPLVVCNGHAKVWKVASMLFGRSKGCTMITVFWALST